MASDCVERQFSGTRKSSGLGFKSPNCGSDHDSQKFNDQWQTLQEAELPRLGNGLPDVCLLGSGQE